MIMLFIRKKNKNLLQGRFFITISRVMVKSSIFNSVSFDSKALAEITARIIEACQGQRLPASILLARALGRTGFSSFYSTVYGVSPLDFPREERQALAVWRKLTGLSDIPDVRTPEGARTMRIAHRYLKQISSMHTRFTTPLENMVFLNMIDEDHINRSELAAQMGVSYSAVKRAYNRVAATLKRHISDHASLPDHVRETVTEARNGDACIDNRYNNRQLAQALRVNPELAAQFETGLSTDMERAALRAISDPELEVPDYTNFAKTHGVTRLRVIDCVWMLRQCAGRFMRENASDMDEALAGFANMHGKINKKYATIIKKIKEARGIYALPLTINLEKIKPDFMPLYEVIAPVLGDRPADLYALAHSTFYAVPAKRGYTTLAQSLRTDRDTMERRILRSRLDMFAYIRQNHSELLDVAHRAFIFRNALASGTDMKAPAACEKRQPFYIKLDKQPAAAPLPS